MEALTADRIIDLYEQFRKISPWQDWHQSFLAEVNYFNGLTDRDFINPDNQEKLWRAKGICTIGPGESVDVKGAYADPDIVNQLLLIRKRIWAEDQRKRAKEINDAFDHIMGLVHNRHSTHRPWAKQSRLFTALHPSELHTCFNWKSQRNVQELVLGSKKFKTTEGAVLVRARLREILGKEDGIDESIWRAMFCWWLNEEYEAIKQGVDVLIEASLSPTDEEQGESENILDIWPVSKQRKGLSSITGYLEALRMVVSAARGGATPEDIVETMMDNSGFANYVAKSCRVVFNLVRTLGFLENREGLWYPSEEGEQLVEDDPANVLVEKILVQVFGIAHMLKEVGNSQPAQRKVLLEYMRELWPNWTSDFMPSAIAAWLRSLGLITVDDNGSYELTAYGEYWNKRLPAQKDIPRTLPQIIENDEVLVGTTLAVRSDKEMDGLAFKIV